jgi:hypothetical protein
LRRRAGQGQRRKKIVLYSAPLLALALLFGVYYVATAAPQAAEDFTVPLSIEISTKVTGGAIIQNVLPKGVGVSGIIWNSHQYDSDGLNGHYPVFAQGAPNGNTNYSLIHVRSKVARTYTLLDFFNVWGVPLGKTNTLGYPYTVPPPASVNATYSSDWYWDLCVQSLTTAGIHGGSWDNQPLLPGEGIVLLYSNYGCLPYS